MTLKYDLEHLKQLCAEIQTAAAALSGHNIPDWLHHRLAHLIDEVSSLCAVMDDETSSGHGRD